MQIHSSVKIKTPKLLFCLSSSWTLSSITADPSIHRFILSCYSTSLTCLFLTYLNLYNQCPLLHTLLKQQQSSAPELGRPQKTQTQAVKESFGLQIFCQASRNQRKASLLRTPAKKKIWCAVKLVYTSKRTWTLWGRQDLIDRSLPNVQRNRCRQQLPFSHSNRDCKGNGSKILSSHLKSSALEHLWAISTKEKS